MHGQIQSPNLRRVCVDTGKMVDKLARLTTPSLRIDTGRRGVAEKSRAALRTRHTRNTAKKANQQN
ncbi:MAG: hypothetical protein QXE96_03140 [Candidatus Caldarchaeum sp.]